MKYSHNDTAYECTWKEKLLFHVFLFYSFCRNKTDAVVQFSNIASIGFINLVCKIFNKTNIFTPWYAFNYYKRMTYLPPLLFQEILNISFLVHLTTPAIRLKTVLTPPSLAPLAQCSYFCLFSWQNELVASSPLLLEEAAALLRTSPHKSSWLLQLEPRG